MIPVTQTKVVVKDSTGKMVVRGNCFAACVASLVEMPITDVPNVEVLFDVDGVSWYQVMTEWLRSNGFELKQNYAFDRVWHDKNNPVTAEDIDYTRDKYYLVSGVSPRGINHVCIFKNGVMVHDPHPTREGITDFFEFEEIIKI